MVVQEIFRTFLQGPSGWASPISTLGCPLLILGVSVSWACLPVPLLPLLLRGTARGSRGPGGAAMNPPSRPTDEAKSPAMSAIYYLDRLSSMLLLFTVAEFVHVQVLGGAPLRRGHVPQPRPHQHQRRLPVGEAAHHPRPPQLAHQPLEQVVRLQLPPVLARERHVRQRVGDP